jgi:6-pyruvoyltetrahydropterin/6-carboxytetrahydropterin synthase
MLIEVFKEFTFEASHSLPFLPEGHKCKRLHGHSYHVTVRATIDEKYLAERNWMVVDYADISAAWEPLHDLLDHRFLNDVDGLTVTTSECLAIWIYRRMKKSIPEVCSITVRETATAGSTFPRI